MHPALPKAKAKTKEETAAATKIATTLHQLAQTRAPKLWLSL